MDLWKNLLRRTIERIQRYPGAIALFGFISGVASFVLVDRQAGLARIVAVAMVASWLWLMLENLLNRGMARLFGFELPRPLLRYATQMIHQESLFFALPFFAVTTTWNSTQALFTVLLGGAALLSIIDPIYYRWLAPRRWLFLAYHTLALFAVLLSALPIILHLTTAQSYTLALATAAPLSVPSLTGLIRGPRWWWRAVLAVGMALLLGASGWLLRTWVPPATLWLTARAVTTTLDQDRHLPGAAIQRISSAQLRGQGLFAYTSIAAPLGLNERIYHLWQHAGETGERIPLDIHGGRRQGYRAWTHKQNFPQDPSGPWQVRVITENGQLLGILRFQVVD